MARIFIQNQSRPGVLLDGLGVLVSPNISRLRVAVAYVSSAGANLVCSYLEQQVVSAVWQAAPKHFITSFDFGHTEPNGLRRLLKIPNTIVKIADTSVIAAPGFAPATPFHPKMFIADRAEGVAALIGSANISNAAFTDSAEAAMLETAVEDVSGLESAWNKLWEQATTLNAQVLADYESHWSRSARWPGEAADGATEVDRGVRPLLDAIDNGQLELNGFVHMWVEAGSMTSGGSHNQLEFPRGGNRFFGGNFADYGGGGDVQAICDVALRARGGQWIRPLRWHSHNRMERLNLPTLSQGGYDYASTCVLFTRGADGYFEMTVAPWDSSVAERWRAAAVRLGKVYRFGESSPRICGFF